MLVAACGQLPQRGGLFKVELARSWRSQDVKSELAKQQQAHPKRGGTSNQPFVPVLTAFDSLISEEDWAGYDKKLDNFYLNYELYIQRLNIWGENNDRTLCFDLWLENSGNAPAEDIDVFLTMPPVLKWVADSDSDAAKPLFRPEPPEPPERPFPRLLSRDYYLPQISPSVLAGQFQRFLAERDRDKAEVWNEGENGFCIHEKIRRLKHGELHKVGSFFAVFGNWDDIKPFEAGYTLSASELPERVTGKVPFIVRVAAAVL